MTTLPLPPGTLAVLLLLGLGAAVFVALALTRPRTPDRPAAGTPEVRPEQMLMATRDTGFSFRIFRSALDTALETGGRTGNRLCSVLVYSIHRPQSARDPNDENHSLRRICGSAHGCSSWCTRLSFGSQSL